MPEVLLTSGAALQLDAAQQKRPKPPLAVSEFKSDGAAAPHGMYDLNATMRLLQQIDLETAAHHADSSPLPGVDQASLANPQSSRGHDAAADMAAGTQSRLPGSAAPATAVDVTLSASCSDQMQVSAVRQDEGEEAQNLTDGGQQAGSHEQEAASFEQDSHQCPEDPRLAGEDDDSSTEGEELQDDSYADDSQGTGAEAWDEREQASHELKSKAMAGGSCLKPSRMATMPL